MMLMFLLRLKNGILYLDNSKIQSLYSFNFTCTLLNNTKDFFNPKI